MVVTVQCFLVKSKAQINKSKILVYLTRSLACTITHSPLHTTALFDFGDDQNNTGSGDKAWTGHVQYRNIDTSRSLESSFFDPALLSLVWNIWYRYRPILRSRFGLQSLVSTITWNKSKLAVTKNHRISLHSVRNQMPK